MSLHHPILSARGHGYYPHQSSSSSISFRPRQCHTRKDSDVFLASRLTETYSNAHFEQEDEWASSQLAYLILKDSEKTPKAVNDPRLLSPFRLVKW